MEVKEMKMDLAGRELRVTNHPLKSYADGFAMVSLGDTVIMANALIGKEQRDGMDFFPLTVSYEENMYAAGKIKGSRFIKREGRPSENATLISRMIDRPMRPLFPKGARNEVQLILSALSVDLEVEPDVTAMNAASVALLISGAPFEGPVGAVRIGYHDKKLVVNPTYTQVEEGKLNLVVAGTLDAITMVEAGANEVSEELMLDALDLAHKHIKELCRLQLDFAAQFKVEPIEFFISELNPEAISDVESVVTKEMLDAVKGTTKKEVKKRIQEIEEQLFEKFADKLEEEVYTERDLAEALNKMLEKNMRQNILEKEERIDGRKIDEVRPISVVPDVLPRTHGSAIFQRGETMALTITTLGGPGDAQLVDTMEADKTKRYFHHYHFPPYATGDIKPLRGPNRREIGHGYLAERSLVPVLPEKDEFPYTIWAVSEITSCNGSSSMASVCGSTLSLMSAGVPIARPVSGIAMGLVMNKESGDYKILKDIQGLEDFAGDMDFKVAGTDEGITALQMDIKIKGLSLELMKEALMRAKEGRKFILDKMLEVVPEVRPELSKYAPLIMKIRINPDLIKVVIGKGGETINKMIDEFGVEINIDDDGLVTVTAPEQEAGQKAIDRIKELTYEPKVGDVFDGTVVRIMDFGAFVEIVPGKDGLVHISKLAKQRVNKVEDVVNVGDKLKVKLVEIDDQGRYNLSHVAVLNDKGNKNIPKSEATISPDEMNGKKKEDAKSERVEGTAAVRRIKRNNEK
ncbi:polyribonucleotide nucleotidyltransferase [Candidatus Peregrinibacteria bacterium]|nr:polyribonucleotide nucleotidyltransferase [Candidatus Peregrinibacteria bacterium]